MGPGDVILTTPFTFIATAEVISVIGAKPAFVDVDPRTFNIDPNRLDEEISRIKKEGREKIRGIIPVDLFGLPADYEAIRSIASRHDLFILEDAAQALGATYKGKKAGALGDVGATSFFPSKPLGCYGDGGAVFTDHDSLAETMRSIRVHGQGKNKYDNVRVGLNARLDTLQAAVLLQKLPRLENEIVRRNEAAARYSAGLSEIVTVPSVPPGSTSAWAQYSILTDHREKLQNHLKEAGIPMAIYYPKPLHMQEAYRQLGLGAGRFPVAEELSRNIVSLPMHPYLTKDQQDFIIEKVKKALC